MCGMILICRIPKVSINIKYAFNGRGLIMYISKYVCIIYMTMYHCSISIMLNKNAFQ